MIKILLRNKLSIVGFTLICLIGFVARYMNGAIYSENELLDVFGTLQQSGLYLGSAISTSSGTTLALMLTMVGLVRRLDQDFDAHIYQTVALIGIASTICLISSILLLLTLTMPIGEFDGIPEHWYRWLYNITFGLIIFICAMSVAIVLMLVQTVVKVISKITPTDKA